MTLLAPLWLLLLIPWAGLWAWRGRGGEAARVSFLGLWPRVPITAGPRRRRPPLWMALLLSAVGLAIVATAGPARVVPATTLTVVIDSGPALTPARLRQAIARLLIDRATLVHVVPSVGEAFDEVGGITVSRLPRSALADDDAVRLAARRAGGPAVVVADHVVSGLPAETPVVTPPTPLVNAGIDRFAVAVFDRKTADGVRPSAQTMVRVLNHTTRTRAWLQIDQTTTAIDLPPPGASRDYFIDLPAPGPTVRVTLEDEHGSPFADDVPADDRADLARANAAARVEPRGPLPTPIGRFLAVYATRRPADGGGGVVTVGPTLDDGPGVQLASSFVAPPLRLSPTSPTSPATRPSPQLLAIDASHPVTRAADLRELVRAARVGNGPPDDGRGAWRTLVRDGADVLLAVRESPARQAWVGVDTTAVADSPAFVVLWTDLLDWLAGGGAAVWENGPRRDGMTAVDVADASLAGGPGLYRQDDRTVAVSMPAVRPGDVAPATPLPTGLTTNLRPLSPVLLLTALGLLTAGLWLGRRSTKTAFAAGTQASPGLTRPEAGRSVI